MKKHLTFFIATITILLLVSIYFSTQYFSMKKEQQASLIEHSDLAEIYAVLDQQLEAWNKGDHEGFMMGYWKSDSLRFITDKGIKYGWDNVLKMYQSVYDTKEKMGTLNFYKDAAYPMTKQKDAVMIVGRWEVIKQDTAGGTFALIFRKKEGSWKITEDRTF